MATVNCTALASLGLVGWLLVLSENTNKLN